MGNDDALQRRRRIDYDKIDGVIYKNYPEKNYIQISNICKENGCPCSANSVRLRVVALGLQDWTKRKLRAKRNKFIYEHFGIMTYKEMAEILGIGVSLVEYYIKCMGLD